MGKIFDSVRIYGTGTTTSATLQTFNGVGTNTFVVRDDGNVGIGTSTPTEKLEVSGNTKLSSLSNVFKISSYTALGMSQGVGATNVFIGGGAVTDGTNGGGISIGPSSTSFGEGISIGQTAKADSSSGDAIAIGRSSTANGSVRSVAIGRNATSSASNAWALGYNATTNQDNTFIFGNSSDVNIKSGFGTNTPEARIHIKGSDSSSSNYGLKVQNSGGTYNLVVRNDGNVGIGNSTPNYLLDMKHVAPTTANTGFNSFRVLTESPSYGTISNFEINTNNVGGTNVNIGKYNGIANSNVNIYGLWATMNVVDTQGYYPGIILRNVQGTTVWDNYANVGSGAQGMNFRSYYGLTFFTNRSYNSGTSNLPGMPTMVLDGESNNTVFGWYGPTNYDNKVHIFGDDSLNGTLLEVTQPIIGAGSISITATTLTSTTITGVNSYFTRSLNVGENVTVYAYVAPQYTARTYVTLTVSEIVNNNLLYTNYDSTFSGTPYYLTTGFTYYYHFPSQKSRFTVKSNGKVGIGTYTPTEKLDVNGKTKTINLQVTSGATPGYVLTSDASGNATWQQPTGTQDSTTLGTGLTIHFSGKTVFNLPSSPASGNISGDTTNAKLGMIQKIYHQSAVEPTFPVTWKLVGEGVYFTNELNIIYAEYVEPTWIEYWIIQQQ